MNTAIYTPYLDTASGGEKYMLTIAEYLSQKGNVDVLIDTTLRNKNIKEIIRKIETMHNLNLSKINMVNAPLGPNSDPLKRLFFLKKYDYLFYNSDGSVFLSTSKNSIVHFQLPFEGIGKGIIEKAKFRSWKEAIYNSDFTKNYIEKTLSLKGVVVYPPVDIENFKSIPKKRQILSVGRFSKFKKHNLMIKVFKDLLKEQKLKKITLHLAGGTSTGDGVDLEELKKEIKGYPIYLHPDVSLKELTDLYGESLVYWHAAGFEETNPKNMEHFGISTVEAMAAGCIPVVINLGGQKEIVENEKSGFLWNTINEWKEQTLKVLNDKKLQTTVSKNAINRSKLFSKERFCKQIEKIVYASS